MSIIRGVMGVGGEPDDSELKPFEAIAFFPSLAFGVWAAKHHPICLLVGLVLIYILACYLLWREMKK